MISQTPISYINWNEAVRYAKLVQLAEQEDIHHPDKVLFAPVLALGAHYLGAIVGSQLASYFKPELGNQKVFGFAAVFNETELVIALRCTETFLEAVHDAAFMSVPNPIKGGRGFVAVGFSAIYESLKMVSGPKLIDFVKDQIGQKKFTKVTLCGHSLGGPLVTLLAMELRISGICIPNLEVYTYGSPRVGGMVFALQYNSLVPKTFRIVIQKDVVQTVPLLPAYYHVDTAWALYPDPTKLRTGILCQHHISSYIWAIEQFIGVGDDPIDKPCQCGVIGKFIGKILKKLVG